SVESSIGDEHGDEHHDDEHGDEHHDDEHGDEHHDDEHGDEHHDDEHGDEHHDDHADHDDEETHSSVLASYTFNCGDASKLAAIDVTLLERWSGFAELDVQMAGPKGQSGVELSPQQIRVDITQIQ
ncbi:MAG: DUF2796 domain-containing protein, partial [Gammaproteobacteria bacterium]|nr:DUF2796 domain-containing protein [Gammaproteobacteria bacterium]